MRARVLTSKERLGPKWSDEQRIDNCNVPVDKRGIKPRPSACANTGSAEVR
jgi:ribosomal protein L27